MICITGGIHGNNQCDVCLKAYRYSNGLRRHLKYECGKEPQFQCPHCPYKAKQKVHLKSHVALKHIRSLNF